MGLLPLEFTDGLTDSPYFRETLQAHERELDLTNTAIKHLMKDIRDLIAAARNLSRAQRTLSDTLNNFNFECIGNSQTDDELVIANSFKDFARLLTTIEDERDRLLEKADEAFLEPIEKFRREQIGSAKEAKKKFEKETAKYCQNLERYLNLSVKKSENQLCEADANNSMEQQHFFKAMSEYVLKLQEVNERKKFEFVETVLSFMLGWLTFYHQGHEIATDFYSVKMELQMRLQRTRNNFNMTQEETKSLRQKMLDNQKFNQKFQDSCSFNKNYTRQGYLFLMEKKAFTTSWTKHFCQYEKPTRRMTMIQYTQTMGRIISTDEITVKECIKRAQDTIDRRFCFDIVSSASDDRHSGPSSSTSTTANGPSSGSGKNHSPNPVSGDSVVYTFQALSEEDYKYWLETLEARDPYPPPNLAANHNKTNNKHSSHLKHCEMDGAGYSTANDSYHLDAEGYWFVKKCIRSIEARGLDQKGIYRVVGVASRVRMLMEQFAQSKSSTSVDNGADINLDEINLLPGFDVDSEEYETKTITSALKSYLRNLDEPIMTFQLHNEFIAAAKLENRAQRIERIHQLVHRLPSINFKVLKILIEHLQKVAKLHDKNLMTSSNLGVCFGPTLLRPPEESVAAILDIKFVNVIAELLIENFEKLFLTKPNPDESIQQSINNNYPKTNNNYVILYGNQPQQIQQRPLPNIPVPNQMMTATYAARNMSSPPSHSNMAAVDSRRLMVMTAANQNDDIRSHSQDQLYQSISPRGTRNMYHNGVVQQQQHSAMLHQQHSKTPHQNAGQYGSPTGLNQYSQYSRRGPHISSSLPSPSSLGSTALSVMPNQPQQHPSRIPVQYPQKQSNSLYAPIKTTASASNSGQLLQPSMSYQNLHYMVDVAGGSSKGLCGHPVNSNNHHIYTRPMTSIGIVPPNSNYATLVRPDELMVKNETAGKLSTNSGQIQQPLRSINLSSSSSASLPSTPEHSQSQFPYKLPQMMAMPLNANNKSPTAAAGQPPSSVIYGTVGQQPQHQHRMALPAHQQPLPSTTVRTRYVCIGSNETELSFQPNMIITNVRTSREPGWLEGNLNGKTGLIPHNYVEFIE